MESVTPLRQYAAAAALAWLALLGGCGLLGPRPSQQAPASDPDSVRSGYALMYSFVARQKNSDKILIVKRTSPQVKTMMQEISAAARHIDASLKAIAQRDPAIELDRRVLPLIEAQQRESAELERGLQFLGTSGRPFERLLLLTQSGVLTTERHLSRAMRDAESDPERKAFWARTAKTFDEIYAKLNKLLEDEYFSP